MTSRKLRKEVIGVALFPFLAVLVCTMGALIVILMMVVHQARLDAATITEDQSGPTPAQQEALDTLRLDTEEAVWQRELLEGQRAELTTKLADGRLELSHLEDHIRRLEDQWRQMRAQAESFAKIKNDELTGSQQAQAEVEQLRAEIAAAQERLSAAREKAAKRKPAYAIIPYDGPNGTLRRPIYVECTEHGIILQPHGVVLNRLDFEGPLGPGNPLDAALRAIREHWAQQGDARVDGEPYPLLIVRPNGTLAYNYAREALKDWDDEFGYELIDAEMQLAYPKRDPALAERLERVIAQARERQTVLAAAMPSEFGERPTGGLIASASGGFQAVGGSMSGLRRHVGTGDGSGRVGGGDGGARSDNSFRVEGAGQPSAGNGPQATGTSQTAAGPAAGAATAAGGGAAGRPGAQGAAGGQPGSGGSMMSMTSMSQQRGANWATPKAAVGATAYTIPVRVVCQDDKLILLPRPDDDGAPVEVAAADPLSSTVEEFVKVMWRQIDRWQAPPVNGYWQPLLEVYVPPGAEERFLQLQTLLEDSGIKVQRQAQ